MLNHTVLLGQSFSNPLETGNMIQVPVRGLEPGCIRTQDMPALLTVLRNRDIVERGFSGQRVRDGILVYDLEAHF